MSNLLDFDLIYTSTGTISQLEYATKCADAGSTIIAAKSKHGCVVVIEKPIKSDLVDINMNKRLKNLFNGAFITYTGLLSDGVFICDALKHQLIDAYKNSEEKMGAVGLKNTISMYLHNFTRYFGLRTNGCHYISGTYDNGEYKLILTNPNSTSHFYKACSAGKGSSRATTELEKIDFDNYSCKEIADTLVRIMYTTYDPLKDKNFIIEMYWMNKDTNFEMQEVDRDILNELVDEHKDLTVDG